MNLIAHGISHSHRQSSRTIHIAADVALSHPDLYPVTDSEKLTLIISEVIETFGSAIGVKPPVGQNLHGLSENNRYGVPR